jgi:hypothetical protein
MPVLNVSREFPVAAEKIWALLVDFGDGFQKWWPDKLDRIEIEGKGLGTIRHLYNNGRADPISEQLDALDHARMILKLSIVRTMPLGMTEYHATGTLTRLGPNTCRMDYEGRFEAPPDREPAVRAFLLGAYARMFDGLGAAGARAA